MLVICIDKKVFRIIALSLNVKKNSTISQRQLAYMKIKYFLRLYLYQTNIAVQCWYASSKYCICVGYKMSWVLIKITGQSKDVRTEIPMALQI